jgi:hypothetical protein
MQVIAPNMGTKPRNGNRVAVSLVLILTAVFVIAGVWFAQFGR